MSHQVLQSETNRRLGIRLCDFIIAISLILLLLLENYFIISKKYKFFYILLFILLLFDCNNNWAIELVVFYNDEKGKGFPILFATYYKCTRLFGNVSFFHFCSLSSDKKDALNEK